MRWRTSLRHELGVAVSRGATAWGFTNDAVHSVKGVVLIGLLRGVFGTETAYWRQVKECLLEDGAKENRMFVPRIRLRP